MLNSLGVEYPFSISDTGTKTYTLSRSQIGDVYFPAATGESGTFSGMSIVAIMTEGLKWRPGDWVTAPISVLVIPVADPAETTAPTQATDEDNWVTFGDDITPVVNDASTQTITNVTVTDPYRPRPSVTSPRRWSCCCDQLRRPAVRVTLAGASRGRDPWVACVSLSVLPPLNADQNITLSVSAMTEDLGGVTDGQITADDHHGCSRGGRDEHYGVRVWQ
ncbi:MAG: hypothetical protein IPL91_11260 [Hyphomicrobium sp.]|nr:hypothetical protein [Hyphomicrobium sp.]